MVWYLAGLLTTFVEYGGKTIQRRDSMAIFELLSQRLKKQPDVYQYDTLPPQFRVQVAHIWRSTIGSDEGSWNFIKKTMCRELGVFRLGGNTRDDDERQCVSLLLEGSTEEALDIIELSFRLIDRIIRDYSSYSREGFQIEQLADDAIDELNHRFKQHGIGYEYNSGVIIRIDSQHLHVEAIKPALSLLHEVKFKGANEEFQKAHKHYREGNYKEAIAEALKSFESTLKSICEGKGWAYSPTDTASKLIAAIFDNKLLPDYLSSHFTSVRSCLEAGLPTVRNKTSGHGQGQEIVKVPEYFAAYAINLAATNIVLLVNAFKSSK